jgi:NADPH-dependent 2,4-dienoyl-CoA reductase/sulfur reductase-like enzyme
MAEALTARGIAVHLVEMLPQIMPEFDAEMVEEVAQHLAEQGVQLHTSTFVQRIEAGADGLVVVAEDITIPAGLVLITTGVRPNAKLAEDAGLRLGKSGAIRVDDHMRTSDPDIYAAGDCVEHYHQILGDYAYIPLAPSANKGGRIAGDNISGGDTAFPGIAGTAVVKVFDYTLAITGLTEKAARASGQFGASGEEVGSAVVSAFDKAHYWPGAEKMKVKLVFRKGDERILGCQLVGKAGVNKRVDIVVAAMAGNLTVSELALLDLSYAPPYSPVYDPLQVCANVAAKGGE